VRVLIISSLFLICWSNSSAQVSFGVKFGGNVNGLLDRTSGSLVYSANKEELSYGSGFHVGFYSRFSKGKLSFIPEIQYSKRNISNSSYNLIELPLLLNYRISKFIEIDGGGSIDYLFSSFPFEKEINLGVLGGLRLNISRSISILTRYSYGLTSMRDLDYTVLSPPSNTTNLKSYWRMFQIGIAYRIK
jgi:hypothetical protein